MHKAAPTPRIRGAKGQKLRARRLARTNGLCEDCQAEGRVTLATVVDHIVPLAHGGAESDENTRNLCKSHHDARTAEQFGFRQKIGIGLDGWPVS